MSERGERLNGGIWTPDQIERDFLRRIGRETPQDGLNARVRRILRQRRSRVQRLQARFQVHVSFASSGSLSARR